MLKYNFLTFIELPEDYTSFIIILRNKTASCEEKDLYWRKCAPLRFQQIKDSKSTAEILHVWPEYTEPAGSQKVLT